MTRRKQETLLWIGALALGGAAIAGAVVLHGQMIVTQSNSGALQIGGADISTLVIISPASLELPPRLGPSRAWGLATQLYSVRSQRSWGIGDLTDLTDLAVWSAAQHGAGFVLVNPLHAAAPVQPLLRRAISPLSAEFP